MVNHASKLYIAWGGQKQLWLLELVETNTSVLKLLQCFCSS